MTPRILVVGEALTDIVIQPDGSVAEHPGGSPMNVAVGLARLGIPTEFHTMLGVDDRGAAISRHLIESGVALSAASETGGSTSSATATIGRDGAASYDFDLEWDPAGWPGRSNAVLAVHTGSLAAILEPGAAGVRAILEAAQPRSTLSYDPNVRPQLMGEPDDARDAIEALVSLSDVVKASDEDLDWLYPGRPAGDVAADWLRRGPSLVVVTAGRGGVLALGKEHSVALPVPSVPVVDTIGAGDSFMAGLLAALDDRGLLGAANRRRLASLSRADLQGVLEFALGCAAVTVTRAGAAPPTRDELAVYSSAG